MIVLRKQLVIEKNGVALNDAVRYFFYLTNETQRAPAEVVLFANERCQQENLIAQLKNGVCALKLPVNTLESNGAYMVIGALAWTLKAWLALLQPQTTNRNLLLKMEFKKFLQMWLLLTCPIVQSGRRVVYRILQYNVWVPVLLQAVELLRNLRFP